MDHLFFGFLWTLLATGLGDDSNVWPQARIWNGSEITFSDYRFFAQLSIKIEGSEHPENCSGSVISKEWIITAAHCGTDALTIDITTAQFFTQALAFYPHPLYERAATEQNYQWDVGLIKIPLQKSFKVTLSLPAPGEDEHFIDAQTNLTILGHGWIELQYTEVPTVGLRKAVKRLSHFRCNHMDDFFNQHSGSVCIKNESPLPFLLCPGDSGAPVFAAHGAPHVLLAVASTIKYKCGELYVGFHESLGHPFFVMFHRVSAQIAWLLNKIDSESHQHGLESIMHLWMTDFNMPPQFP